MVITAQSLVDWPVRLAYDRVRDRLAHLPGLSPSFSSPLAGIAGMG
jgi:hypothetical protein